MKDEMKDEMREKDLATYKAIGGIEGTVKIYKQILEAGDFKRAYVERFISRLEEILKEWKESQ